MPDNVEVRRGTRIRLLEQILARPVQILKRIGALVTSRSQKRFGTQEFSGKPWPPPMTPNIPAILSDLDRGVMPKASRLVAGPALKDTGHLMASINWRLLTTDTVEIGTALDYAKFHQFGLLRLLPVTAKMKSGMRLFLKTPLGRMYRGSVAWILGMEEIEFQILKREFIGVDDQDMADIQQIILDGVVGPTVT